MVVSKASNLCKFCRLPLCCKFFWNWIKSIADWCKFRYAQNVLFSGIQLAYMTLLLVIWTLQFPELYTWTTDAKAILQNNLCFRRQKSFFLPQISILLEFSNNIICDCPLQNKRFRKAMYGLEKRSITLKYYHEQLRESIDDHVWFRHSFLGKEVLGEIFCTVTPSSTVVLLFSGIFLVPCSFK